MVYRINGINIADYGFIPRGASGSNIAIEGIFDLPSRVGTCYHVWGEDSSVEAYVDEDDIELGARTITIYGTMWCASESKMQSEISLLRSIFEGKSLLLECDYGDYNVVLDSAKIDYWGKGKGNCTLVFREPYPTIIKTQPITPSVLATANCIETYSFESLGLILKSINGCFDITGARELKTTSVSYGGSKEKDVDIQLWLRSNTVSEFKNKLANLSWIFASEGTKTIKTSGASFDCFAIDGFKISDVWNSNGKMIGLLTIKLMMI